MTSNGDADESNPPTSTPSDDDDSANNSWRLLSALTASALLLGTVVFQLLEDWGWIDSFYFSVITLTTVGYGDFSPTTNASKLFSVVYIFSGISLIGAYVNEVMKHRARKAASRRTKA